ncbi:vWA domain-containing protein [Actinoplanes sp. DH11]|uniref:vWA domain-containing protein n=1 Tax=Actinoplanes sp. DH11 TaxID=2857011 RepID=UPI001E287370|nr:vWA domain-containing protein [Actinoplanes sp. DH11]
MTRPGAVGRPAAYLVVLLLALLMAPPSPTAADPPQASLAEVLDALRTDELAADYVVLLDVSSSMQPAGGPDLYTRAQRALRPLLDALSPVDRLHLVAFADRPDPTFTGRIGGTGAGVLSRLPDRAEGGRTDIGAAIESALDTVDRPDLTDPATVVLLTDGVQDPPPGSRYDGNIDAAITRLRERATGIERRRPVRALGIPLTGQTDVRLLDRVFDDTVLMDLPPDQVGTYLSGVGSRVAMAKAAALVARDRPAVTLTTNPGPITVRDEPVTITATVRNEASRVPLTVTPAATVEGAAIPVRVLTGETTVAPGAEQTIQLRVDPPGATGRWIGGERSTAGTLRIEAAITSPWRDVIVQDLGLALTPEPARAAVPVRATATGIAIWLVTVLGLLLVALVALLLWLPTRRWRPMGGGQLTVTEPGAPVPYRQMLSGRKVRFPAPHGSGAATQGSGTVRAFRQRKRVGAGRELVLRIDYRRAGRRHRVICPPRQTRPLTDGTTFTYQP